LAILQKALIVLDMEVGRMIRRALIFLLLFGSTVYSQAKVGTTGVQFLELPLSVRSAGMGDIGSVLIDSRSYLINPATLGFIAPYRASLQLDPLVPDLYGTETEYYSVSGASRIRSGESGGPAIGIGARYLRLTSASMAERTYEEAVDTDGREFAWTETKAGMAIGLGWSGKIDLGAGAGMNYIREGVHDYHADSWSADLGIYFGIPVRSDNGSSLKPPRILVGAAMSNIGPDITFLGEDAPLPRYLHLGVGTELVLRSRGRDQIKLLPAIEYQRRYGASRLEVTNLGVEAWIQELICGRVGRKTTTGYEDDQTTWGLGFSTVGLRSHTRGDESGSGRGFFGSVVYNVDIQLSFAHQSEIFEGGDGTDYYGMELMF
jgi:hypothetical protein